jgi:DNA end-binding protein Ku
MLGPDGQPLARKYYAEKTGKDLDADDTVRGYEIADNKFVIVTDEELERLAPEKTRDID